MAFDLPMLRLQVYWIKLGKTGQKLLNGCEREQHSYFLKAMTLKTLKAIDQSRSLNMPFNNYKLLTSVLTDMTYSKRKILFTASLIWRVSVIKTMNMHSRFRISRKKDTRLLWRYLLENRCFTVGKYIWDLWEYVPSALQVRPSTFLYSTWISMVGMNEDSFWVSWAWKKA